MAISWNEDLRTGDDQIDHQHMYLIEQTNRLYELVGEGIVRDECERLVSRLIKYAAKHFAAEEALMEELSYPRYSAHLHQHQEFAHKVHDLYARFENGEEITRESIQRLLSDWFEKHIRTYDLDLARFAKKQKVRAIATD